MAERVGPVRVDVETTFDESGFERLERWIDRAKDKVKASTQEMDTNYLKLGRSIASASLAFGSLYGVIERVSSGQADIVRLLPSLIAYFISLGTTIWTIVGAEKARGIAHAVANALAGPVGWAILAGAAGVMAAGIAMTASIPSRQAGGPIFRTGQYWLHKGEMVTRGGGVNITITGNTITPETLPAIGKQIIDKMRAAGAI